MIIQKILKNASQKLEKIGIKTANLDAEILLCFVLKRPREWLYANSEKELSSLSYQKYQRLILRRIKHEPIAYIIGKKEFYGLNFKVNKDVLIPRPETEHLVESAIRKIKSQIRNHKSRIKIIDVGTGCGNIAITIAKKTKFNNQRLTIFASDIFQKTLRVAKENAKNHKVINKIKFIKSNLFKTIPQKLKFDIIIANLPYLDKNNISQNPELKFEPTRALYGGKNGLVIYQKFFQQVKNHLKKNSEILIEIGNGQFKKIQKIIRKKFPEKKLKIIKDFQNIIRSVIIY